MRAERIDWDGSDPRGLSERLRALQPGLDEVSDAVAEIVASVASGGDEAVLDAERRFGGSAPAPLVAGPDDLEAACDALDPDLRKAIELAERNVRRVAEAEAEADLRVTLEQGQSVRLRSVPVGTAGAYAPGGTASYPSSALMCTVPAAVAEVERIAVASPPAEDGKVDPVVLAAAAIGGAERAYATGGAQAIAAMALGTESIDPVDVVVGPGNRFVQEAKRQLSGRVGIDGVAGPSELMVVLDESAELRWLALDLCAQGEHGDDGLLVAVSDDAERLAELERLVAELAPARDSVASPPIAFVTAPSLEAAVELANELAPEHLQIACEQDLSAAVTTAGCVFVGNESATAFGDYAAGSNHVLPTGGAGRFTGPLGPSTFRRRMATVRVTHEAARELAGPVATLARIEGFPVHGESVEARRDGSSEGRDPEDT